jgi:hypothetical protein
VYINVVNIIRCITRGKMQKITETERIRQSKKTVHYITGDEIHRETEGELIRRLTLPPPPSRGTGERKKKKAREVDRGRC